MRNIILLLLVTVLLVSCKKNEYSPIRDDLYGEWIHSTMPSRKLIIDRESVSIIYDGKVVDECEYETKFDIPDGHMTATDNVFTVKHTMYMKSGESRVSYLWFPYILEQHGLDMFSIKGVPDNKNPVNNPDLDYVYWIEDGDYKRLK